MKTSSPHKVSIWSRLNIGKIALVAVALVFVTLLVVAISAKGTSDGREEAGTTSPAPTPTNTITVPFESTGEDENGEGEGDGIEYPNADACENTLTADEVLAFQNLVMDYEEAYQSPPSLKSLEQLTALTTADYKSTHDFSGAELRNDIVVEILRDKTSVACTVNANGSRLASTLVVIKTSSINDSGEKTVEFAELRIPLIHYSTWVLSEGQWRVTAEE
jgi:hypothetical protein